MNLENIDFETLKSDVIEYIQSKEEYSDLLKSIGSNLDMFVSIFAGYGTWLSYKYRQLRKETYLSTAQLETSVYKIAKTFGYNINRPTSLSITIQYRGEKTILLETGEIVGNFNYNGIEYDVVYMENDKLFENDDFINLKIGIVNKMIINYKPQLEINLLPEVLPYIDNYVKLKINGVNTNISKNVEDYIVKKQAIDFSNSLYDTQINLTYEEYVYGLQLKETDKIELIYLETIGKINDTENNILNNINIREDFLLYKVNDFGTLGDDLNKIKKLTPYYFKALRRMVSASDNKYILEANEYLKNVTAIRDDGIPIQYKITLDNVKKDIRLKIKNYNYLVKYDGENDITLNDVYEVIKHKQYNSNYTCRLVEDSDKTSDGNYIYLDSYNGRDLNEWLFEYDNLNVEIINNGQRPMCCTILIYYIHRDVIDKPVILTDFQMSEISKFVYDYKIVGTKLLFIPAKVNYYDINISVHLKDNKYFDFVKNEIYKILAEYELLLDKDFIYGEFIVKVSNIKFYDENNKIYVNPVEYIKPNQEMFDIINDGKNYIKFDNVNLNLNI